VGADFFLVSGIKISFIQEVLNINTYYRGVCNQVGNSPWGRRRGGVRMASWRDFFREGCIPEWGSANDVSGESGGIG